MEIEKRKMIYNNIFSLFYLLLLPVFRGLPDTDTAFFNLGKLLDRKDVTDSYVTAYLDNCRILMTSVKVRGLRRYCWTGRT
jgi:hypothetical protein